MSSAFAAWLAGFSTSGGCNPTNLGANNVACIDALPCPTSSSSAAIVAQLKASIAAAFSDSNGVEVSLESWSALRQCSDPDNDGNFTFWKFGSRFLAPAQAYSTFQ